MQTYKYVILGGGLTAGYAAQEFAKKGLSKGELCIISAEEMLPYERPPLSKSFLAGKDSEEDLLINGPNFYLEHGIVVKLKWKVRQVDLDQRILYSDRDSVGYEKLLIATGARPRKLSVPGSDLENIFYLRNVEDARRIRRAARDARNSVVIGGGFIGMESAAVLRSLGLETTMVFPDERVWQSFFTAPMSAFFQDYYCNRGVVILPETEIDSFLGEQTTSQVVTTSGQRIKADIVVAGIGAVLNTELFADSGMKIGDEGISVNRFLETNLPDVFAAGDVTRYRDVIYDSPMHIEHWDNAVHQGRHAARVMLGEYQPYEHVPYFFSDEFDLSFEFWGDTTGAAEIIHLGDVQSGRFSVWWLAEDSRLLAAFVMNRPENEREAAQNWIKSGRKLQADQLQESEWVLSEAG